jgi:hypothetical protein
MIFHQTSGEAQAEFAGGINTKILCIILLLMAVLTSVASAEYTIKNNLTLDMKQSVSGEGYFMTYKNARMPMP